MCIAQHSDTLQSPLLVRVRLKSALKFARIFHQPSSLSHKKKIYARRSHFESWSTPPGQNVAETKHSQKKLFRS
jgi:hypothetical protein